MATATAVKSGTRMTDEQVVEVLGLIRGADSAELKLTIPEAQGRAALQALGVDPLDAQVRQVYFLDTPALDLSRTGVVVRARRVQGRGDDTVVKLRPITPDDLPPALRKLPEFGVEVDAMPGGFVCSGSLKHALAKPIVREACAGARPLRKLFSKEQRALYAERAPEGIELDDLSVLGPIFVLKVKSVPRALGRKQVVELWLYPDDSRILELSMKCAPSEAFEVAAELRAYLVAHGIDLSGEQETKTRKALQFFSKQLKAERAG